MDLSSPTGASVNDAIDKALCSLNYTSVDEAVAIVRTLGQGALMAKLDLKSAYRMVPVAPVDQPLLGFTWDGQTFLDAALPFGLRSAPKLFTAVADALAWAMAVGVSHFLHYPDDFFIAGPAENPLCALHLNTAVAVCDRGGSLRPPTLPCCPLKNRGPININHISGHSDRLVAPALGSAQ